MKKSIYDDIATRGVGIGTTKPTTKEEPIAEDTTSNSGASLLANYNDYVNQIKMNKMNARSELSSAQEKSNVLMNNYLKALGVQGSGLGQSAIAQNNQTYANMMNKSDLAYDDQLRTYREEQASKLQGMAEKLAESGATREEYNNLVNSFGELGEPYKAYYDAIANQLETQSDRDSATKSVVLESIDQSMNDTALLNNLSSKYFYAPVYLQKYKDIIYNSDINSDEYKWATEAYDRLVSGQDVSDLNNKLGITKELKDKLESNDFYKALSNVGDTSLDRGTTINSKNPLWNDYQNAVNESNSTSSGKRKGYVEVKYNGHTYTISKNDKKILAIDYVY